MYIFKKKKKREKEKLIVSIESSFVNDARRTTIQHTEKKEEEEKVFLLLLLFFFLYDDRSLPFLSLVRPPSLNLDRSKEKTEYSIGDDVACNTPTAHKFKWRRGGLIRRTRVLVMTIFFSKCLVPLSVCKKKEK